MTMMTKLLFLTLGTLTMTCAQPINDQDMDGVPDSIDKCPDTPFLVEVNAQGCSTKKLALEEKEDDTGLTVSLSYGISNNEDVVGRDLQHTSRLQVNYYYNDWSFSAKTGYFTTDTENGLQDSSLKVKRKFRINDTLKVSLGAGVKLPTYDFPGNKTDLTLYSSLTYYPVDKVSLFMGASHTFINDIEENTPLQDTDTFYIGTGHFFTKDLYANISYSYAKSKFVVLESTESILSTLFYRINDKWFTTLSYSHQLNNEELQNALSIKFGYRVW